MRLKNCCGDLKGQKIVGIQTKDFRGDALLLMTKFIGGSKNECLRCIGRNDLWSLEEQQLRSQRIK